MCYALVNLLVRLYGCDSTSNVYARAAICGRRTEQLGPALRRCSRDQKFPFGLRQVRKGLRDVASTLEITSRAVHRHHNGIRFAGDNASAAEPDAVARLFTNVQTAVHPLLHLAPPPR